MTIETLDDLPLLESIQAPKRKTTKAEREQQEERRRSEGYLQWSREWTLRLYLSMFSLADVQRMWFEEQEKIKVRRQQVTP